MPASRPPRWFSCSPTPSYSLCSGEFIRGVLHDVDEMNSEYLLTFSTQRWLSVRLDIFGIMFLLTLGVLVVTSGVRVSPSIAGLVLSQSLGILQLVQFTVR